MFNFYSLLYLISDYILLPKTVQILEYLIQDLAINRLRWSHLILATLPYLKILFFTRLQTNLFKVSPHELKMLRPFDSAALSKKPMNCKLVMDWINNQLVLFQWIVGSSNKFAEMQPKVCLLLFLAFYFRRFIFGVSLRDNQWYHNSVKYRLIQTISWVRRELEKQFIWMHWEWSAKIDFVELDYIGKNRNTINNDFFLFFLLKALWNNKKIFSTKSWTKSPFSIVKLIIEQNAKQRIFWLECPVKSMSIWKMLKSKDE